MDDNKTKTRRRIDPLKAALAALILSMLQAASNSAVPAPNFQLRSPNGQVTVEVDLKELRTPYPRGIRPYYRIRFNGETVVRDSWLGLHLKGGPPLARDFVLLGWDSLGRRNALPPSLRNPGGTAGRLPPGNPSPAGKQSSRPPPGSDFSRLRRGGRLSLPRSCSSPV